MQHGVCRWCGATDAEIDGDTLRWYDTDRTCCSKYGCIREQHAAQKAEEERYRERTRRKTPAEIHELIRRSGRRRRKTRAA